MAYTTNNKPNISYQIRKKNLKNHIEIHKPTQITEIKSLLSIIWNLGNFTHFLKKKIESTEAVEKGREKLELEQRFGDSARRWRWWQMCATTATRSRFRWGTRRGGGGGAGGVVGKAVEVVADAQRRWWRRREADFVGELVEVAAEELEGVVVVRAKGEKRVFLCGMMMMMMI